MNILLTSVGRRSYLVQYFKETLKGCGKVHVANSSWISPAFMVADHAVITPKIYDDSYIPFLLQYCKDNRIAAIIPLFDVDLPVLARNKSSFAEIGTDIIVSDEEIVDICNDKWKTFLYLKENGFNVPLTFITIEDTLNAIDEKKVSYPLFIKPRWGMGSIAVYEAECDEELKILYKKAKRDILKTYLKYESAMNIEFCVIIQEKLTGQEYGLDVINDLKYNYQTTVVKKKYAMRAGETDCAVTVNNECLKRLGRELGQNLKHIANLDVDVFEQNEKFYILEMNARFGGGYPFSHMAGINLPLAIVKWLKNEIIDQDMLIENNDIISHKDINLIYLSNQSDDFINEKYSLLK